MEQAPIISDLPGAEINMPGHVAAGPSTVTSTASARLISRSDTLQYDGVVESGDLQIFCSKYETYGLPKHHMPNKSIPAGIVYQSIKDLRQLDANPRLNLASFVTTWMEEEAIKLITESLNVNYVDLDEYPSCTDIHNRCLGMLADLYNVPDARNPVGTGTIGSSEAIMLAGLAMKKKWQKRRREQGLPTDKPNMVMGANVQVCWEKFCRYFDVEERYVMLEEGRYVLTPELARPLIDENTIGVVGILGSTYNGEFEDIKGLDNMIEEVNAEQGWNVPIHVDGASGGFVAPFLYPELEWDFRLKNVRSINVSGHKYGLVFAGIGWVLWQSKEDLPEEMVFHINYLGTDQPSVTLNFSRGASHIIAQYYQLLRLGREGYTRVMRNLQVITKRLADGIMETKHFELLSKEEAVPLVAFRLLNDAENVRLYDEFDISDKLKENGWVVPAYTMAPNAGSVKVLRVVVRMDMSMTVVEKFLEHLKYALKVLDERDKETSSHFQSLREKYNQQRLIQSVIQKWKTNAQC